MSEEEGEELWDQQELDDRASLYLQNSNNKNINSNSSGSGSSGSGGSGIGGRGSKTESETEREAVYMQYMGLPQGDYDSEEEGAARLVERVR